MPQLFLYKLSDFFPYCTEVQDFGDQRNAIGHVVMIGAGPAGLTAGYLLSQKGIQVSILEMDPDYLGGISKTIEYHGFYFDIGGHRFFSKSQEIENLWSEVLPHDLLIRRRSYFLMSSLPDCLPHGSEIINDRLIRAHGQHLKGETSCDEYWLSESGLSVELPHPMSLCAGLGVCAVRRGLDANQTEHWLNYKSHRN